MRFTWLFVSGCGLFEGVESPFVIPPCVVLSEVEVTDPEQDVGFLAPLGARLDAISGAFDVSVTQRKPDGGPYAGTLTVTPNGTIRAIEQQDPPEYSTEVRCANTFRVPVDAALDLDGGLFHLVLPLELSVTDESPAISGGVVYREPDGVWRDLDEIDFSATLDLRKPITTDTSSYFVDPEQTTMSVEFADGVVPSGTVELYGVHDVPEDEVQDGTESAWVSLSF
jgi:hypothetical protein